LARRARHVHQTCHFEFHAGVSSWGIRLETSLMQG